MAEVLERAGANPDYQAFPFLDDFPLALAVADAVVARAGGSVAEILARGVPSLLVPYPLAAGDHQTQERPHGRRRRRGAYRRRTPNSTPSALAEAVDTLLDPDSRTRRMRAAGLAARPAGRG